MNSYEKSVENSSTRRVDNTLPAPHGDRRLFRRLTGAKKPSVHGPAAVAEDIHIAVDFPLPEAQKNEEKNKRTLRLAVLCILLSLGAAAILLPLVRSESGDGGTTSGESLGGVIPGGNGSDDSFPGGLLGSEEDSSGTQTQMTLPTETQGESRETGETAEPIVTESGSESMTETERQTETDTEAGTEAERESERDTESDTDMEFSTETQSETTESVESDEGVETAERVESTESATESLSETETCAESASDTETEIVTEAESESEVEAEPVMPEGAFSIVSVDLSEPERSVGYIHSTADRLPPSIPAEGTRLWSTEAAPTVLIVHTHPYEGYHDGKAWYDPADGSLAQTDIPGAPDGVVALGAALTHHLRDAGVTVIHLRVPVAEGESAASTYEKTKESVRYYCELYPDIGLILDLRRSAELSASGEIIRTEGRYQGEVSAQIRLAVSGDRPTEAVSRDIALAVALRRSLWAEEPTISRPVWVKSGEGLVGDMSDVAMLTVEVGSCGNRFSEVERLVAPLGDALIEQIRK